MQNTHNIVIRSNCGLPEERAFINTSRSSRGAKHTILVAMCYNEPPTVLRLLHPITVPIVGRLSDWETIIDKIIIDSRRHCIFVFWGHLKIFTLILYF